MDMTVTEVIESYEIIVRQPGFGSTDRQRRLGSRLKGVIILKYNKDSWVPSDDLVDLKIQEVYLKLAGPYSRILRDAGYELPVPSLESTGDLLGEETLNIIMNK